MLAFVALAISFSVASVRADLGKTSLFPNGLHDPLSGLDNLRVPASSVVSVTPPDLCVQHAQDNSCDTSSLQAFTVTYDDCTEPWTICRCSDAQMDQTTLINRFGQIPPGVRSYVGSALAVQAGSCSAGSGGDFIVFSGDCSESVFDHESGHSLDQNTSPSQTWADALAGSTCVPDDYADTSTAEDFAQVNVLYTYQTKIAPIPADTSCLQPQLDVFSNTPRIANAHSTTTCTASVRPFDLYVPYSSV
ncbi:hypothetical protein OF83DRAFT_1059383 [Amylostereum chailletii]|nr:hypothetical protein OF83DRAFT_1059383 [Amylostereum chailletii]